MKLLAVTACPSGVAHTYMAAEALQKAAEKKGIEIKVETQGSIGRENIINELDVKSADAVILTKDIDIMDEARFKGKPIVRVGVSEVIRKSDAIVGKIETLLRERNK
jgi:fructose-specific PTS system IIB-like component